ncbi:MAG: tRNA (adenosine(37)-N6)-threonylcarbamoyltransferase complex dimerization subunit type 1 TsaB [Alphaproteobacteria bacterium]|nr:tRNA (adenosine(37)-N6)-threonylcarbamoyltransferase complex dimerization subunit type 1 TsaB [Alphaproteobacteria bacterium]
MTKILALDTSCASCSAAVWSNDTCLASKFEPMMRGQSENLIPFIDDVLKEANVEMAELDALAVTTGPGAFTGIRICLSTARALALALNLPLVDLTTMEALISATQRDAKDWKAEKVDVVAVLIETKRQDLYVQLFDTACVPLNEPVAMMPQSIVQDIQSHVEEGKALLIGDGAQRFIEMCEPSFDYEFSSQETQPNAGAFGARAYEKLMQYGSEKFLVAPKPIYLRPPDAIPPKPKFHFKTAGSD